MIINEYGNNVNVTERSKRMLATGRKASHSDRYIVEAQAVPEVELVAERWQAGFEAYCRGAALEDLHGDEAMEDGWWYANHAEAYADALALDEAQANMGTRPF